MQENDTQFPHHKDSVIFTMEDEVLDAEHAIPKIPVIPQLSVALGLLALVFGVTYIGATQTITKQTTPDVYIDTVPSNTQKAQSVANVFADTSIQAKAAIIWDVKNQRAIFNKNADDQLPLASITKLMTALVAYELLDPEDKITISVEDLKAIGDSGLIDGEKFTLRNLIDLTLISSSNDGATAIGATTATSIDPTKNPETVFVKAMNLRAKELGLTKTYFNNSTGLDTSESIAGSYGSARDVSLLMEYIITHITDAVALTNLGVKTIKNENGEYHLAENTNDVVNDIDGLIASKTGYTTLSGGNLVIAFNAGLNRPIVITVLGSSQNGRFVDTLTLVEKVREYIANEN